jgi:protein-disulfide isomerase
MDEYPGTIRLVIKHYPYQYRDFAYLAAEAAEAARVQGQFWPMHDLLLKRKNLDRDSLLGYAAELGLDRARFQRELDGNVHRPRVEADVALAKKLDLYQTPTFIINGRRLVGNRPIENFRALIDEILSVRNQ